MVLLGAMLLRRFPDAPLALLIGRQAKRATEIGAPSLKHPFARVFAVVVATSPLANSKWRNAVHMPILQLHKRLHICVRKMADVRCLSKSGQHADFGRPISAVIIYSLVRLKILFRKECPFESGLGHHLSLRTEIGPKLGLGSRLSGAKLPERSAPRFPRKDNRT
jgi:hypothetical protein